MKFDRDSMLEIGQGFLTEEGLDGVRWPDTAIQRTYTGADGQVLLRRTVDFVEKLVATVPALETDNWTGLDYGAGFGRIASLVTRLGHPSRLTCADAWNKSLDLCRNSGLSNPMLLLDARLASNSLPLGAFDFVYAYSIFTHFPEDVFLLNFAAVMQSLRSSGVFVFTLREEKFLNFLDRNGKLKATDGPLPQDGFWFGNVQSKDYGDSVASDAWIEANLAGQGILKRLGSTTSEPFQCIYAISKP